jgi:hypothetical protein
LIGAPAKKLQVGDRRAPGYGIATKRGATSERRGHLIAE